MDPIVIGWLVALVLIAVFLRWLFQALPRWLLVVVVLLLLLEKLPSPVVNHAGQIASQVILAIRPILKPLLTLLLILVGLMVIIGRGFNSGKKR